MYKKWLRVSALGMAVLIGCMMPVDTMIVAAEENQQEIEVDSVSDDDAVDDDGAILDGENAGDEENADDGIAADENVGDETDADEDENTGDEVNADEDENAGDEISADEDEYTDYEMDIDDYGIVLMAEAGDTEVGGAEAPQSIDAPVITITFQGQDYTRSLGGTIDFKYINNGGQALECSASQADSLSYCLEKVDAKAEAKGEGQMDSLNWQSAQPSLERIALSDDAHYVLYVKAVGADGQPTYARSGGIVVDTIAPGVTKLVDGGTYPEGTTFQVSEANLESVTVNEKLVNPESDGSYQVSANGTSTSCVVKVKDKAGNETTYSITISRDPAGDGIISENGIYSLKAGTSYQLAAGKWQVGGDKSVYSGGITFYVKADGDYTFTKR